jgi:hypothetical protein
MDESREPFDEQAYTKACVRTATIRHLRKRSIRETVLVVIALGATIVPWYWEFDRSSTLVWYVGMAVALFYERTEQRLKTMQIRLARMHDLLHRIRGNDIADEELMELVSEDGPVKPDPKLWPTKSRSRTGANDRAT